MEGRRELVLETQPQEAPGRDTQARRGAEPGPEATHFPSLPPRGFRTQKACVREQGQEADWGSYPRKNERVPGGSFPASVDSVVTA